MCASPASDEQGSRANPTTIALRMLGDSATPLLDAATLTRRVNGLRALGVRMPKKYPPANLPSLSPWFRGVLAQVEVAELLIEVLPPDLIEIEPAIPGGDVDIAIHTQPSHYLQVKEHMLSAVSNRGDRMRIEELLGWVCRTVQEDMGHRDQSTVSMLRIHLGKDGQPAMSGETRHVASPGVVNVYVVDIEAEVVEVAVKGAVEKRVMDAVGQLRELTSGILVPVVDLTRYPHDQASLYRHTRDLFRTNTNWNLAGGVLLLTNDYVPEFGTSAFHSMRRRLIAIENPNTPSARRIRPETFNPPLGDETVYAEGLRIISVWPRVPYRIDHDGQLFIGVKKFAHLPGNTGVPFAVRL